MPLTSSSSKAFYYDIDLQKNSLFNAKIQPVTTAERTTMASSLNSADKGIIVYDTTELVLYTWNGNTWDRVGVSQQVLDQVAAAYNETIRVVAVGRTETTETITLTKRDNTTLTASVQYAYIHTQGTAATSWVITHNLGKYPSVSIVDSANSEVIGEVVYNSNNQLTVSFSAAFSGKAYLN